MQTPRGKRTSDLCIIDPDEWPVFAFINVDSPFCKLRSHVTEEEKLQQGKMSQAMDERFMFC